MEYELSKRLIKIAGDEKKVNRKFNLAAFIIMRPQINKAINDGWSIKFIWETLSQDKKIGCSYRTFLQMCKKHASHLHDTNKESDRKEKLTSLSESKNITELNSDTDNVTSDNSDKTIEEENLESDDDRIKISNVKNDTKEDYGNPKGFEWDTNFDPKDFV